MEKINKEGILQIVATPIGNLEDITLRALRSLREADLILCEDTRVTMKLLQKYEIKNQLLAFPSDDRVRTDESPIFKKILNALEDGATVAMVTDAGTPGISDPGNKLVHLIRKLKKFKIEAIPGPSALVSAVSISGFSFSEFNFLGFPPNKKGRQTFFAKLKDFKCPVFFYESRFRILKTLQSLVDNLPSESEVFVGRELTKFYEESFLGSPAEVLEYFSAEPKRTKGEFVIGIFVK